MGGGVGGLQVGGQSMTQLEHLGSALASLILSDAEFLSTFNTCTYPK
jgi:hypothetical protein